ncbi:hypothetical protein ACWKSR_12160, partial [Campylobacter fetus subsp. venerealis]
GDIGESGLGGPLLVESGVYWSGGVGVTIERLKNWKIDTSTSFRTGVGGWMSGVGSRKKA